jgi:hypothetical protein
MMFGTNRQFTLERLPFSRENAFLSVYQDNTDGGLYLSICRSNNVMHDRPSLMKLTPLKDGEELPFTYDCDGAKLIVSTYSQLIGKGKNNSGWTKSTRCCLPVRLCNHSFLESSPVLRVFCCSTECPFIQWRYSTIYMQNVS